MSELETNRLESTAVEPDTARPAVPEELGRAGAMHLLGRKPEAVAELDRLLEREQECAPAYRVRAMILMELDEYPRALDDWERYHALEEGDPQSRLSWAQCMQHAGRWAEASERFAAVLAADPGCDDALLGLGLCQLRLHRAEESLATLTKYLERRPSDPAARFGQAVAFQITGETGEAVRLYEALVAEGAQAADALVNLITIYRQQKDGARLEECSRRLLQLQPESEAAREAAAYAAYLQEDFARAADNIQWLVERDSKPVDRWMNLGLCRRKEGKLEQALDAYREALRRQADLTEAHVRAVEILLELGREGEALDACRAGIQACPDGEDLYLFAVGIHEKAGRSEDAEALLEVLAVRHPDHAEAWFHLGNLKFDRQAYPEAQDAYRAALTIKQDWAEARLNLALAFHEAGEVQDAAAVLDELLKQRPDWEPALRAAAVAALKLNNLEGALAHHKKLIETGHGDPEVLYNTALLSEQLGQSEEAELLYRQALEWKPEFAEALIGLGYALEGAGRSEEARECWAKAMQQNPALAQEYFGLKA